MVNITWSCSRWQSLRYYCLSSNRRKFSARQFSGLQEGRGSAEIGTAGWPPGLHVYSSFGDLIHTPLLLGTRSLLSSVKAAARGHPNQPQSIAIPQPVRSAKHNLAEQRSFLPLRIHESAGGGRQVTRRCEHFAEYGNPFHSLTYFRGNGNLPSAVEPLLTALRTLPAIKSLASKADDVVDGDELGLHWKLTINHYKERTETSPGNLKHNNEALNEAGGALFPWHTDLAANGEITAIFTLLSPALLEFAPHAALKAEETATRISAEPDSLVLLSGPARWEWVHRAVPHPDASHRERFSLVLGCAPKAGFDRA